jgi:hypothetical protein
MLGSIIIIAINVYIFSYIVHLNKIKCVCAEDWKQRLIKYISAFIIIYNIILIIFFRNILYYGFKNSNFIRVLRVIHFINIFYYISILLYFIKLRTRNCVCSRDWRRKLLLYPVYIFILIALVFMFCRFKYNTCNLLECINKM